MTRLTLPALIALALVLVAQATPAPSSSGLVPGSPSDLRGFLLRADEPLTHDYARTPSFAWKPVVNAIGGHYQFQISTSQSFQDGTLVFKDVNVAQPAETVPRQLPWMTGQPFALWARARWISTNGLQATNWSKSFGFNIQWTANGVPAPEPAPEGLVRWTPIDGATAYEVLYPDLHPAQSFQTTTNVADEREFFTWHTSQGYGPIHWRVRAIRDVGQFQSSSNGLPAVSYGPWSPTYTTVNTPQTDGTLKALDTVSDVWDKSGRGTAHLLTPGVAWSPSAQAPSDVVSDLGSSLYRVYIFSDSSCVNRIFTGSVVGSPAWAPRTIGGGTPAPPTNWGGASASTSSGSGSSSSGSSSSSTSSGSTGSSSGSTGSSSGSTGSSSGSTGSSGATTSTPTGTAAPGTVQNTVKLPAGIDFDVSGAPLAPNETAGSQVSANKASKNSTSKTTSSQTSAAPQATAAQQTTPSAGKAAGVDLWDSGWPSGRFYWTVVPVTLDVPLANASSASSGTSGGLPAWAFFDTAVPQDSCHAGNVMSFGKVSQPIVTAQGKPFVSGIGPKSRSIASAGRTPVVYSAPIVAWQPVVGATKYQVELSRSLYPWRPAKTVGTPATSVVLPISKSQVGVWYYHVRAIDENLPAGARSMAWSTPVEVKVTGNLIKVVR
jgi:hypothetical protein